MHTDTATDKIKEKQKKWERYRKHLKKVSKKKQQLKYRKNDWR